MIGHFSFNRLGDLIHTVFGDVSGPDEMNLFPSARVMRRRVSEL